MTLAFMTVAQIREAQAASQEALGKLALVISAIGNTQTGRRVALFNLAQQLQAVSRDRDMLTDIVVEAELPGWGDW